MTFRTRETCLPVQRSTLTLLCALTWQRLMVGACFLTRASLLGC